MSVLRKSRLALGRTESGAGMRKVRKADHLAGVRMAGVMHLLLHTRLHDLHRANFNSKTQTFKNSYESSLLDYYGLIKMCKIKVIHISQCGIVAAHTVCLCVLCGSQNKVIISLYVVLPKNSGNLNRAPETVVVCPSVARCG